jgi:sensor histidine kinase YesM
LPTSSTGQDRRRLFWKLQIAGWVVLMPILAILVAMVYADPATALLISFLRQSIGFGVTLGLWLVYRNWPAATFHWSAHAWQIAGCCLLATVADVLLAETLRRLLDITEPPAAIARGTIVLRLALYVAWSALYFSIRQELESRDSVLRAARSEADQHEVESHRLRAQLNPHFLLGSLLTIVQRAESDPPGVRMLAGALADYLRYTLRNSADFAPLGDELAAMTNYLRAAQINHATLGFAWNLEASPEARAALVPTALVQPLVENAIKYGAITSPVPLRVGITAGTEGDAVWLMVENTGTWVPAPSWESELDVAVGIGLANLRRRLELLYGDDAKVDVSDAAGRVRVEVRLPLQSALVASR